MVKYKYSPMIPTIDYGNFESRRNWILFMAKKTGRLPVREVIDTMTPHVSKMTVNNDFKALEEEGLIRREKDKMSRSFVIPMFEDSGEAIISTQRKKKILLVQYGLPLLTCVLFVILLTIHITGFSLLY